MRVGLTLSGDLLNDDGAKFAAQPVVDVVVHLTDYSRNAAPGRSDRWLQLFDRRRLRMDASGRGARARHDHDIKAIDPDEPIPDGMVWNMRYRDGRTPTPPVRVFDAELRDRLTFFRSKLKAKKANREDER